MSYVKLTNRFPAIIAVGNSGTAEDAEQAAIAIEQGCKEKSRYATGTMRNGWQTEQVDTMTWRVFNPVGYTIFNELGTVFMSAQPMLIPTIEEVMPDFEADVRASWVATRAFGVKFVPGFRI